MNAILDASAAIVAVMGSAHAPLFRACLSDADWVAAPDLLYSEACNTAWKLHRLQGMPADAAARLAAQAFELVDEFLPSAALWPAALELACKTGHPAYDCFYLAAAIRHQAALVTADQRLAALARSLNVPAVAPEG
jgi:predicted nucleic acid-binding protein